MRDALPGHDPLARISHTDYVLFTITATFMVISCDMAATLKVPQPCRRAGRAITAAWQLTKVFTAADPGGAS
ncbi:hypothetical protein DR64_4568 [Paraburkholderia xenovorans LB400]|uniref:hypothetical protein n=1 Tax=Paraburkholderia xenovorans TaxID=36873 RepID=UPI000326143A|nr:hypothetical protein [Paraburkholderia xenovorans]AIP37669.1 hypothetical protein DR64_4568 [Paraburkholderia xenovorans LB400]NPT35578.1 hypothetical protein [Paraburkholderia xenovorans]